MHNRIAQFKLALALLFIAALTSWAQAPAKQMTKDDVFRAIAAQVITQSESPVTSIIGALDDVIEVGAITLNPKDGKWQALVKEKTPATTVNVNREIPLVFAAQPDGTYKWEQFKNDARFYPVERLFPYAKDYLTNSRNGVGTVYKKYLTTLTAEGEAAFKVLDTAKAIIKKDPEPLAALKTAREALKKAIEANDTDALKQAYKDMNQAIEPIAKLPDDFPDLKANDAYLRLAEGLETLKKQVKAAREEYVNSVNLYNDRILRLPFTLTAFGTGFTKMDLQIELEQ